jgi:hypothetical protein
MSNIDLPKVKNLTLCASSAGHIDIDMTLIGDVQRIHTVQLNFTGLSS